jgi:predicted glycosyltransferase
MMKILLDIGHPAHVHYYRNFIKIMKSKGHRFLVLARNRDVIQELLNHYSIPYVNRGKGAKSLWGKILNTLWVNLLMFYWAIKFRPNIMMGHGSPYIAQISWLLSIPSVCTGDSDHISTRYLKTVFLPFLSVFLTPSVYSKSFGKKHFKYNSFTELFYLHPKYFVPNEDIYKLLNISKNENYFVLRFVSWDAFHDNVPGKLTNTFVERIISLLEPFGHVVISSEKKLPDHFSKYQIKFPANELHSVLANASLYIGEGATTASEAAILGTPSIYINPLEVCYCKDLEESFGLCFNYRTLSGVLDKITELINDKETKLKFAKKRNIMIHNKICLTDFLVWFVENYPKSKDVLIKNPDFQNKFL